MAILNLLSQSIYQLEETKFMEIGSVDNHDDFYHVDREMIHVQDQRGVYVMYDVACQDLKALNQVWLTATGRTKVKEKCKSKYNG